MSETAITIPAPAAPATKGWPGVSLWHDRSGFGFHDVLDTINPLQHIPIVGTIYRAMTGDEPGALPRVLGDGLFGGPFGLISGLTGLLGGLANVLVQADTGKDIGEHVLATIGLDGDHSATQTAVGTPASPAGAARGMGRTPMPLSPSRYILPTVASGAPAAGTPAGGPPASAGGSTSFSDAGSGGPPAGSVLSQHPVPLEAMGVLLPNARPRPLMALPAASRTAAAGATGSPAAPGSAGNPSIAGPLVASPQVPGASTAGPLPAGRVAANPLAPLPARSSAAGPAPAPTPALAAGTPAVGPPTSLTLPQNPPLEISQKMMDGLDKYAKFLQQQRGTAPGAQVNLTQ